MFKKSGHKTSIIQAKVNKKRTEQIKLDVRSILIDFYYGKTPFLYYFCCGFLTPNGF